ncbi:MAG TPA: spermidine/putrescine ABC transporter substrate-binding protein [Gammaproteobacteria bacterium]|nr:spermidine/putrescine ABC transporter substrate-binding protein [Gammaproteobacteria bacterium]
MALSRRAFLAGVAALPLLSLSTHANSDRSLHFLNSSNSVDRDALRNFRKATDIDVIMDIYNDEAQFIGEFLSGDPRYDAVLASDDSISHLVQTGLLDPLNRSLVPNIRQIDSHFLTAEFDPNRNFSLPYIWGTLGIGYRKSAIEKKPDSWKFLLDSNKYFNRIALLSEKLAVLQIAQKYLGYSSNSTDKEAIDKAEQLLVRQKPYIKNFSNNTKNLLLSGKVDVAMLWSNDFLKIQNKSTDIGYVVPKEGTLIWQKSLCIPKHAADPVAAHKLIDFLLGKETAARLAKKYHYATPNKDALELMDKNYLDNPALFVPSAILKKSESRGFPGGAHSQLYKKAWERIMGN